MSDRTEGGPAGLPLPLPNVIGCDVQCNPEPRKVSPSRGLALWDLCEVWRHAVTELGQAAPDGGGSCAAIIWCRLEDAEGVEADALEIAARLDAKRPAGQTGSFRVTRHDHPEVAVVVMRGNFR